MNLKSSPQVEEINWQERKPWTLAPTYFTPPYADIFPPEIRSHSQSRHFPAPAFLLVLMSLVLDYELEIRDYSQSRKSLQEGNRAKPSNL